MSTNEGFINRINRIYYIIYLTYLNITQKVSYVVKLKAEEIYYVIIVTVHHTTYWYKGRAMETCLIKRIDIEIHICLICIKHKFSYILAS